MAHAESFLRGMAEATGGPIRQQALDVLRADRVVRRRPAIQPARGR
jgi:hypothetical protein